MPFCGTCGSQIAPAVKFCPGCGRPALAPAAVVQPGESAAPVAAPISRRPLSRQAKFAIAGLVVCLAALGAVSVWAYGSGPKAATLVAPVTASAKVNLQGHAYLADLRHPIPDAKIVAFEGAKSVAEARTDASGFYRLSAATDAKTWNICFTPAPSSGVPGRGFCETDSLAQKPGKMDGAILVREAEHDFFAGKQGQNLTAEYEDEIASVPMGGPVSKTAERRDAGEGALAEYYGALVHDKDYAWGLSYWQTGRAAKREKFFGAWYDGLKDVTIDSIEPAHPFDARMDAFRVSGTLRFGTRDEPFTTVKIIVDPKGGASRCFVTCAADLAACYEIRSCKESY